MSQTKAQLINGKSATIEFTGGSASAPAVSFTGDTNTGIYSPGADQVAISTNGTGRLFVNSSGSVGIGTSSPQQLLHINNPSAADARLKISNGTTGSAQFDGFEFNCASTGLAGIIQWEQQPIYFYTNNGSAVDPRLAITAAGNVGIGTASPGTGLLDVRGTSNNQQILQVSNSAGTTDGSVTNAVRFTCNGNSNWANARYNAYTHIWGFNDPSSQEAARIDASGRLLVGTSSPIDNSTGTLLQLKQNDNPASIALGRNDGSITAGKELGNIKFYGTEQGYAPQDFSAQISGQADGSWTSTSFPSRLVFSTTADGASSPTERMRINAAGAVLVGGLTGTVGTFAWISSIARSGQYSAYQARLFDTNTASIFENYNSSGTYVGGITASNTATSFPTSSDARLKSNIADAESATPVINGIRVVSHGWIADDATVPFGVVAQELHPIAPQAVDPGDDGETIQKTWTVDYSKLVPILIKALQESNDRIETLEAKVAALESA